VNVRPGAGGPIRLTPDVHEAIATGRPVVALETSVIAQGLPVPANRDAARRMAAAIRGHGGVAAMTAVIDGVPTIGVHPHELEPFFRHEGVMKVTARDLGYAVAMRKNAATTVAAALALLAETPVRVFATGGIGGVHRSPPGDESADLMELARTPAVVVCSGAKVVLDIAATLERLETLGIPVIGFGTREFPAFFCASSGHTLAASTDSLEDVCEIVRAHQQLGRRQAVLVVQTPPERSALPRVVVEAAVERAQREADAIGLRGPALTPFLLAAVEQATDGQSLVANVDLLEANADLAARIARGLLA
jgi:pseudouridine-5'-phosphate glycosidase